MSTPCEDRDRDLCTTPGCDGAGNCDQNHIVKPCRFDECNTGECDPGTGLCIPVEPSTPCDTDGNECTQAGCTLVDPETGICDQNHILVPESTPCEADAILCTVDHCDGNGNCVLLEDRCLDHWKGYKAKKAKGESKFEKREVQLIDQFGSKDTKVDKVTGFCNPVEKTIDSDVTPITDGELHYTCYRIKDVKGQPKSERRTVQTEDQFGLLTLDVTKSETLCVPSTKDVVPAGTDCKDIKPIDCLTMIWDGADTVDVEAFRGDVGDTSLGVVTGVTPGTEVEFCGYTGAPNDNQWEVREAGTPNVIGVSEFHISCSDPEMNGAEDCGTPQGNGKGNDASLLNDWLFGGFSGAGGSLDCSDLNGGDPGPDPDDLVGNHFKCYKAKETPMHLDEVVTLADQFETKDTRVRRVD